MFTTIQMIILCWSGTAGVDALEPYFSIGNAVELRDSKGKILVPIHFVYHDGRFLFLDQFDKNVSEFYEDGNHIRTFGAKGEGPGEFLKPVMLRVGKQGHVFVLDNMRRSIQVFENGVYQKTVSLKSIGSPESFFIVNYQGAEHFLVVAPGVYKKASYTAHLVDGEGKLKRSFDKHDRVYVAPTWQACPLNEDSFIMGYSYDNHLVTYDFSGEKANEFKIKNPKVVPIWDDFKEYSENDVLYGRSPLQKEPYTALFEVFSNGEHLITSWSKMNQKADTYRFYMVSDPLTGKVVADLDIGLALFGFKKDQYVFGEYHEEEGYFTIFFCKPKFGHEKGGQP